MQVRLDFRVTHKANCPVEPENRLYFPKAFNPNADGYNDVWEIYNLELLPDAKVFVYNRWGELLFYSKG